MERRQKSGLFRDRICTLRPIAQNRAAVPAEARNPKTEIPLEAIGDPRGPF